MKKQLLRNLALFMVVMMIFSLFTGCRRKVGGDTSDAASMFDDVDFTITDDVVDGDTTEDGGGDIITSSVASDTQSHKNLQEQLKGIGVGKKIVYLSFTDKNTTDNRIWAQMTKQIMGANLEIVRYGDFSGMQQKLASMHMADQAPDLYQMTNQDFPSLMYRGILEPVSDYIDFNSEIYTDRERDYLSKVAFEGKIYFWPTNLSPMGQPNSMIFFNKNLFTQKGIPENQWPDALDAANNWTWDTFYDLQKKMTFKDEGIYGFGCLDEASLLYQVPATTGQDFVSVTEGGFVNNLQSPNITRAMNMLKKIQSPEYFSNNDIPTLFLRGKVAMYLGSHGHASGKELNAMFNEGLVGVVPFPRDPNASNHNVFTGIRGFAVPTGSKESELGMSFIKMLKASNKYDLQYETISYKSAKTPLAVQELMLRIRNEFGITPCISLGIKEIHGIMWGSGEMAAGLRDSAKTWETIAASVAPQMQSILDKLG